MDGANNGKPYEQMDDLGVPLKFGNIHIGDYTTQLYGDHNIPLSGSL